MKGNLSCIKNQIEMKYPGYSVLVPAHWAQYEQVFVCYFLIYFLFDHFLPLLVAHSVTKGRSFFKYVGFI